MFLVNIYIISLELKAITGELKNFSRISLSLVNLILTEDFVMITLKGCSKFHALKSDDSPESEKIQCFEKFSST